MIVTRATGKSHKSHFSSWYHDNSAFFQTILEDKCVKEHHYYLTHTGVPGDDAHAIRPLIDCLLQHAGELLVANFGAAGVLLGLLPTVLSLAGSSTVENGLLALRRPFLALLLSAGSVSVAPMRTYEYKDPVELLRKRKGENVTRSYLSKTGQRFIVIVEYALAAAAVANLAFTSLQIGTRAVNSVSPETTFLPMVYAFLAVPCHFFGALAVYLQVRLEPDVSTEVHSAGDGEGGALGDHTQQMHESYWWQFLKQEFSLSSSHHRAWLSAKQETKMFLFISWFTSTGIVLHLIYGTMILSSTLFVSIQDAIGLLGHFFASTLVCRAILTYELRGLRLVVSAKPEEEDHSYPGVPQGVDESKSSVIHRQTY